MSENTTTTAAPACTVELVLEPATAESFHPFGTVIEAIEDGVPFGPSDARLVLDRGTPRFYIMNLHRRAPRFRHITRHLDVTQCLASVGGAPWFIAVAPPDHPDDPAARPDPERIRAFKVAGNQALMLARGTWHAGPFFSDSQTQAFFNLELADTNVVDHHTVRLDHAFGLEFVFGGVPDPQ